ncbi:MAG: hypothetical protein Q9201_003946 [Fulgogasparrea decipioides]
MSLPHSSPSQPLPTNRAFLTSLFASFPKDPLSPTLQSSHLSNPLHSAPPNVKSLLLTLHVLFPNELLPALDLLDRALVTRLILQHLSPQNAEPPHAVGLENTGCESPETNDASRAASAKGGVNERRRTVYYVQSSHQPRSRFSSTSSRSYDALAGNRQSYEVRLRAWNCTCPAFAFASVACMGDETLVVWRDAEEVIMKQADKGPKESGGSDFGGLLRGEGEIPVCKHLLACYLAESWSGFDGYVEEKRVGKEEVSGWAAGWGG